RERRQAHYVAARFLEIIDDAHGPASSCKARQRSAWRPTSAAIRARYRPCSGPAWLASAPPGDADQEAEADRNADRGERTLGNGVLQRLLDRGCGILRGIHHGAAAFGEIADRAFCGGAGLLVAAPRFLARGAGERIHHLADLAGEGGDIALDGANVLFQAVHCC